MKTPAYLPVRDPGPAEPDDPRLDLAAHLHVLWRNRWLLAGCAVLGGAIALGITLLGPRYYIAQAALAISRPKIGDGLPAQDQLATANFRPLVESRATAAQVIKETGLDKPPYSVSPSSFFGVVVDIQEVRASSVMLVTGRLQDPELVAKVVNRVVELGVETARRISQREGLQARDDIKLQLDEAKKRLDIAAETLQANRTRSQLELVKSDVTSAIKERAGLLPLLIEIETETTKLAKLEQELAKRNRVESVRRSIDTDPALTEAARTLETTPRELLNLQIKNEELSSVYQDLDKEVALSRTKLATLQRQKAQMDSRNLSKSSLKQLDDLYAKEMLIGRLETERDLANEVYKGLARSYENARLMVAGRTSALQILSTAIPPDKPESRKAVRAMLIGVTSGVLLGALVLLLVHAFHAEEPLPQRARV
jgi:uncharacterized protein involved in exopolysaccharide biosynthesis